MKAITNRVDIVTPYNAQKKRPISNLISFGVMASKHTPNVNKKFTVINTNVSLFIMIYPLFID